MRAKRDAVDLLERDLALGELDAALGDASRGEGRVALVSGEAGIGKTLLLERFARAKRAVVRVLWGSCDALFTPRPLAPLYDIATHTQGDLATRLAGPADRSAIFNAALGELQARLGSASIETVLDVGAGTGAASLAAKEWWGEIQRITMLERDAALSEAARQWLPDAHIVTDDMMRADQNSRRQGKRAAVLGQKRRQLWHHEGDENSDQAHAGDSEEGRINQRLLDPVAQIFRLHQVFDETG